MSPFYLNKYNKHDSSFNIVLVDYNIGYNVKGSGNPYIFIGTNTDSFVEMDIITFKLYNTNGTTFSYAITGIDISDIDTNNLNGTISENNSVQVEIREDYKNEGPETLIFTIESLGIAVAADISDTTTNILSIDKISTDVSFAVTLTIPENKFTSTYNFNYSVIVEEGMVSPSGNGFFTRVKDVNNKFPSSITKVFDVIGKTRSQTFTIKLDNTEAFASIILNDIPEPELEVDLEFKDISLYRDNYIDEGGTIIITIRTPKNFLDGRLVPYTITGDVNLNGQDISSSTDLSFNFNTLKGLFIVNNASAEISFVINENRESNINNEKLIFTLDEFPNVSASIFIIDTVLPIAYVWQFTKDINGVATEITSINEGETFTVTLLTQGIDNDTIIDYYIGGSNITIDDFSTNTFTAQFTVGSTMSRDYTVRRDKHTEGIETATFNISIEGEPDIIGSLEINDTSQSPDYNLSSENVSYISSAIDTSFNIVFSITNRHIINAENPLTLNRNETYFVSGVTNENVNGDLYGLLSLTTDHTLTFLKIGSNTDPKTFVFSIAGQSHSIGLNYTSDNPKFESSFNEFNSTYKFTTYGIITDVSYDFIHSGGELSISLDKVDISLSGTHYTKTNFYDEYIFNLNPTVKMDISFIMTNPNGNGFNDIININI